jgi:hypothetical protein
MLKKRDEIHHRKFEELRREVAVGIERTDRGELHPIDARSTLARVRAKRSLKDQD